MRKARLAGTVRRTGVVRAAILAAAALAAGILAGAPARAADPLSIGIVTFSTSDVHTNMMIDSMTKEAEAKGWKVENLNANGEPQQANTAMKQLVVKKVNAIIVTVFDSNSLTAGIAAAQEAGIPVLSAGGGLADGVALAASTGAAPPMVDLLLKNLSNAGVVLNLTYHPGIPCRERADAMDAAAKANPGIKLTDHEISIPGEAETSQAATSAWLGANAGEKGPFAIFNCYDDNAMGAIAALKQNGRSDVQVYSFNGSGPALQAIKDGDMTATLWLDLKSAGSLLINAIPEIIEKGAAWQPKAVVPDVVIVTKDNVDAFMKEHAE